MPDSIPDTFMLAAIEAAKLGLSEGGIPIGSVLVHDGKIIGRGHNRRVQKGSAILHGEMDAIDHAHIAIVRQTGGLAHGERRLRKNVHGFDDQRIAFPMPD